MFGSSKSGVRNPILFNRFFSFLKTVGKGGKRECRERIALLDRSGHSANFKFQINNE